MPTSEHYRSCTGVPQDLYTPGINLYGTLCAHSTHSSPNTFFITSSSTEVPVNPTPPTVLNIPLSRTHDTEAPQSISENTNQHP